MYVSADIIELGGSYGRVLLGDYSVQYSIVILDYLIICLILDCYLISFIRYCNSVPIALLGHVFLGHAV